jgi:hypothetical protein
MIGMNRIVNKFGAFDHSPCLKGGFLGNPFYRREMDQANPVGPTVQKEFSLLCHRLTYCLVFAFQSSRIGTHRILHVR